MSLNLEICRVQAYFRFTILRKGFLKKIPAHKEKEVKNNMKQALKTILAAAECILNVALAFARMLSF